jgi:hypothetical protein
VVPKDTTTIPFLLHILYRAYDSYSIYHLIQHQSEIKKAAGLTAKVAKATGFLLKIVNDILDFAKEFIGFGVKLLEVINVGDDADKDYCVACGNGDFIYAIITDGVDELVRTFAGKFAQAFLG